MYRNTSPISLQQALSNPYDKVMHVNFQAFENEKRRVTKMVDFEYFNSLPKSSSLQTS